MAKELHQEAEFCLPSEFLCDDFFLKADEDDARLRDEEVFADELEMEMAARSVLPQGGRRGSSVPTRLAHGVLDPPPDFFWPCEEAAALQAVLVRQQAAAWLHFHRLKQIQLMRRSSSAASSWTVQSKARGEGTGCFYPSPWRSFHKQNKSSPPGAGMRAVFLKSPGTRSESAGTGVFLPRPAGDSSEPRKKPACSTVLVPERVIQALNLSPEDLGRQAIDVFSGHDASVGRPSSVLSHQRRNQSTPAGS